MLQFLRRRDHRPSPAEFKVVKVAADVTELACLPQAASRSTRATAAPAAAAPSGDAWEEF